MLILSELVLPDASYRYSLLNMSFTSPDVFVAVVELVTSIPFAIMV